MSQDKMERFVEQEKSKKTEDAKRVIDAVLNDFKEDDPIKLPKGIYEEHFKPYLTGEVEVTNENPIISKWIELAGGPKRPVDIINEKGEVIETVPAIIDPNGIDMQESKRIDYTAITAEFGLRNKRSPEAGNEYLGAMLTGVGDKVIVESDNKIIPSATEQKNQKVNDFLEYD